MKKRNKLSVNALILLVLGFTTVFLAGCGEDGELKESTKEIFAMDTYMSFTAYGENSEQAAAEAEARVQELDYMLNASGYTDEAKEGSATCEIYQINENGGGSLSEDADYLIGRALELNELTGGAFNPCMYVVMEAWGFTSQNYRVPEAEELKQLKELTDVSALEYDPENKTLEINKKGMKIDLGGIAKGYTSAQITEIFKANGIESGLINLGGNVQALGTKPDGSMWRVGIQSPEDSSACMGVIAVKDKAVITSGGYERYFGEDGKTYHHIIDPETCVPAENDIKSVTVISEDGTLADALSTALFVMGKDEAEKFWKKYGDEYGFEVVIIDENLDAYVSEGIIDDYEAQEDYRVTAIEK